MIQQGEDVTSGFWLQDNLLLPGFEFRVTITIVLRFS